MKKLIARIKLWVNIKIITYITKNYWPHWEYKADYVDHLNIYHIILKDKNGIAPDLDIMPIRNDITNTELSEFYNDRVYKESKSWLFKDIRLKSKVTANILAVPEYMSTSAYEKLIRQGNTEEAKALLEAYPNIHLDKVVNVSLRVKSSDYLTEEDSKEVEAYLIKKLGK